MKTVERAAYGDFQTPISLAARVCQMLLRRGDDPTVIVEPTCGQGNFLVAATEAFPRARVVGVEIDEGRVARARQALAAKVGAEVAEAAVRQGDFFSTAWHETLASLDPPRLILGNPPWVTSADLGALGVDNLPAKSNFKRLRGLAAKTGKGNFDISEWMLSHLLAIGQDTPLRVAMLVKTAVARRVLEHAQRDGLRLCDASVHRIDARKEFGAAVDAALFCFDTQRSAALQCPVYADLEAETPLHTMGICEGMLVADTEAYARGKLVLGRADPPWRSGIKHDCARVMELRRDDTGELINGLGQRIDVEPRVVYPLLKGADLKGQAQPSVRRWLLVPQQRFGEDTAALAETAPRTWAYLQEHGAALDARRSSIYRTQPRFALFGLGPYSFAPWKVAISGLRKHAEFTLVGPAADGRPIVFDDTCYFIGFAQEQPARDALAALRSAPVQALLEAVAFQDAKRPITKDLLDRIELAKISVATN